MEASFARSTFPPLLPSATYDDANQIATWCGTAFRYDLNGNLTSDGTRTREAKRQTLAWRTDDAALGRCGCTRSRERLPSTEGIC